MNNIRLNRMTLSPAVWSAISPGGIQPFVGDDDFVVGSITDADAGELNAIVRYLQPKIVAEVGTYVGRSTRAIAAAMPSGEIYTCDLNNTIKLDIWSPTVWQFPGQSSTTMFASLIERKIQPDMFYIDGRLTDEDASLMRELNSGAVIVLDDFEGIEKGVSNAAMLLSSAFCKHLMIYPRPGGKTAIMLPIHMLQLTAQ